MQRLRSGMGRYRLARWLPRVSCWPCLPATDRGPAVSDDAIVIACDCGGRTLFVRRGIGLEVVWSGQHEHSPHCAFCRAPLDLSTAEAYTGQPLPAPPAEKEVAP